VSRFAENAQQILEAAATATANGAPRSEMTILIGSDGALHMVADSDWSLDTLAAHHGARSAYRVTGGDGIVRVEGREGQQSCVLEAKTTAHVARLLLAGR
jgi:hypothetical protein